MKEAREQDQESDHVSVKCHARHTIMDGKVVTYATGFQGNSTFPDAKDPIGPFEISVSRNSLMVHSANLRTYEHVTAFQKAFDAAKRMQRHLYSCDGRPKWDQPEFDDCIPA